MNDEDTAEDPQAVDPESPEPAAPEPVAAAQAAPEPAAQEPDVPVEAPSAPTDNVVNVIGVRKPRQTAAEMAQEMNAHDLALQSDFQKGHIKPETYESLFAKKDTLGKIGTLFGLMLSGAGSGLAHQPNALLEMMNKQIDNDLQAQKSSNENAQNWLRLSQAHELQNAQIPSIQAGTELSKAQTAATEAGLTKIPLEKKELEARIKVHQAETYEKNIAGAKTAMGLAILQHLTDKVDKKPPGPAKDNAISQLGVATTAVQADAAKRNAQTADLITSRQKLRGEDQAPPATDSGVDMEALNDLINQGKAAESQGLPGKISSHDADKMQDEADMVNDNRAIARIYDDSFKKLDKAALAGKINPEMRAAEINTLGAEIARATAGRFNAAESAAQADGMFPSPKDWGQARPEKYRKAMEHFKANEAKTIRLDRFGLKTPFPFSGEKPKTAVKEGTTGTFGKIPVVYKNGKWVPS